MAQVTLRRGTAAARIVVVAVALVASFFTVRSGLAFMLATPAGARIALRIDPTNTNALSADADERLKTVELGAPAAKLAEDSKAILRRSPYEVVAMRDIGIITDSTDDHVGANKFLSLAARLSLRDYLTHAWLLDYRFKHDQVVDSVREGDILLRQNPENWSVIIPVLIALTQDRRAIEPIAQTLATGPEWRSNYIYQLGQANPFPDATYAVLLRLKALGKPATSDELAPYFRRSAERLSPQQLFAQWVALLPPSAEAAGKGLMRDGDFAGLDVPPPFGWRLFPADGVYAERGAGPAGMGSALFVSYTGERETAFASQQLVLAPGRYRFSGRVYAEDAVDPGIFSWTVACVTNGAQAQLGRVAVDPQPGKLVRYTVDFDVPANCTQQQVTLLGTTREASFDTIAAYVDGLTLESLR